MRLPLKELSEQTLHDALARYVDSVRLARGSVKRFQYSINRWQKLMGTDSTNVTTQCFSDFRKHCIEKGLSPHSAEQTVYDIKTLAAACGVQVDTGKPLRRPPPEPYVPTPSDIGAVYGQVSVTLWPPREDREQWWRAFLLLGYWTALRLNDLLSLTWDCIRGDTLRVMPAKTERFRLTQEIPLGSAAKRVLSELGKTESSIFIYQHSMKQFRRELHRLCTAAGVQQFTPHDIRRAGITMWSIAHPEAGRIIHGSGRRDVMRHYLSPQRILEVAAPRCRLPDEMLTEDEKNRAGQSENELVTRFRNADPEQRELLLKLSQQMTG